MAEQNERAVFEIEISYAREQLSRLITRAIAGERIIITRHGRRVIELTPFYDPAVTHLPKPDGGEVPG